MAIWFGSHTVEQLRAHNRGTLAEHLGIEFDALGDDFVAGRMPVDARTRQPYGLLHGGASVALAESLGSVGAALTVDPGRFLVVGQEVNANHLRAVRHGFVHGIARPLHRGLRSQVWSIEIRDDAGRLSCVSRLTLAVVARPPRTEPAA